MRNSLRFCTRHGPVLVISLLAVGGGWWAMRRVPPAQPLLVKGDIGMLMPFETVDRPILIQNRGKRAIAISHVRTCPGVRLPLGFPQAIGPQSTVALIVRVRGSDALVEKTITLETDDTTCPAVDGVIRGEPNLAVPYAVDGITLGKVTAGQTCPRAWQIANACGLGTACHVVTSSPHVEAVIHERNETGNLDVDIQIRENAPRGKLVWYMFATTGVPARPFLVARCNAEIIRGARVSPESAFFGIVPGETVASRTIDIEVLDPQWETVEVEPPREKCLGVKVVKAEPHKYTLQVSLDPREMPETLQAMVAVHNGSGDGLQIPVLAVRATAAASSGATP
jgi:hypothetical protein